MMMVASVTERVVRALDDTETRRRDAWADYLEATRSAAYHS